MHRTIPFLAALVAAAGVSFADEAPKVIVPFTASDALDVEANGDATIAVPAPSDGRVLKVKCPAGASYPGVTIQPTDGEWNLSSYTHVAATIRNPNDHALRVHMRIDNPGDWKQSPWSVDGETIPAGETKEMTVRFGYSYGNRAFALDPSKVTRIMLFVDTPKADLEFDVVKLQAIHVAPDPPAPGNPKPVPKSAADVSGTMAAPDAPPFPGEWTTTFEDNFDGEILDSTKWKIAQHWGGINGEAQPHQDNTTVDQGVLWLTWDMKDRPFDFGDKRNCIYGTSEVTSFKRFHQSFGYWECRLKYDVQRTCWPAFWLFPANTPSDQVDEMKWAYLKCDLSGAPSKAEKATLLVKVKAAPEGNHPFDVYRSLDDSWSESTINWENKPKFDAAFLDHVNPAPKAGEWVEIDVTDFINRELAGDRKATFVLADVIQRQKTVEFFSSEAAEGDRPYVDIDGRKVPVVEDATVYAAKPETNLGADASLAILDGYGYNCSTWEDGMEVDIFETIGIYGPNKMLHALHWDGYGDKHQHVGHHIEEMEGLDQNQWTTVGLYWEEGLLEFYVNGEKTWTHEDPRVGTAPSFMLLSAQTGGWGGNNNEKPTRFEPSLPRHFYIDYVKVWSGKRAK